ncbi:MAG: hypothetical protein Q8S14_09505 [Algoriphagus sp.]|jgi:hypothetical protein|uniref:hypothetical protein n=1 Tax=Algoriphagus sp. TaxID=1872435 RepID=UPI00271ADD0D|nr:hypothetical protein [Algoriphagus sp.]MDO8966201.1 hypothetical protein [Algoriphagus sp.]MDP2041809.1 hypothetical protein [Algoriphagus sp.]MDP3198639.1 hypothetical protein [Algoriphagus sp.]MDP3472096.1 hypothetical protein [Algoriphagus sp.]
MNETLNTSEIQDFELAYEERYARVLVSAEKKIVICELLADYIPIEDFKEAFGQIGKIVKGGSFEKFIFDKRSLRAFHQPTMEWYFIHWKKDMLAYGLKTHRKILPAEKWFEKMVQIAKQQILETYPDNIIDQLDIQYCDTIEEAIKL